MSSGSNDAETLPNSIGRETFKLANKFNCSKVALADGLVVLEAMRAGGGNWQQESGALSCAGASREIKCHTRASVELEGRN